MKINATCINSCRITHTHTMCLKIVITLQFDLSALTKTVDQNSVSSDQLTKEEKTLKKYSKFSFVVPQIKRKLLKQLFYFPYIKKKQIHFKPFLFKKRFRK